MATDTIPIADTPDALTPEWVTAALRATGTLGDETVVDVVRTPVGTGQMCDSVRLTLRYDRPTDAPSTLVAKLPAADETSRVTAKTLRSYENEVRFYQQLADDLPVRTPEVHYADLDDEGDRFVLLLEDLAPARGRPAHRVHGRGRRSRRRGAGEAARATLGRPVARRPRVAAPGSGDQPAVHAHAAADAVGRVPRPLRGRPRPRRPPAGDALFANLEAYLLGDTEPSTIVHGDYRLDNLLFDPSPGGVAIAVVDWQTCTHGPALQDVAYFIGAGLQHPKRREVEAGLVQRYHAGLLAAGVTDYDADRCWHDYRRGAWAGLVMAIAASMLVERTDRGDQMFLTMAARHARHALDLDTVEIIAG